MTWKAPFLEVDRAVLIHLLVVFPEVFYEVLLQRLAEAFFHVVQVCHMLLVAQCHTYEVGKAGGGVVREATVVWHERHDAVVVDFPGLALVFVRSNLLVRRVRVGDVEPRLVETVASKHTAHSIADELLDNGIIVPYDMLNVVVVCHDYIPFYKLFFSFANFLTSLISLINCSVVGR